MSERTVIWKAVAGLLEEARQTFAPKASKPSTVPNGPLQGTLEEFETFLEHNELELAWDALASLAKEVNASALCWRKLAKAAELMELPDKQATASQRAALRGSH